MEQDRVRAPTGAAQQASAARKVARDELAVAVLHPDVGSAGADLPLAHLSARSGAVHGRTRPLPEGRNRPSHGARQGEPSAYESAARCRKMGGVCQLQGRQRPVPEQDTLAVQITLRDQVCSVDPVVQAHVAQIEFVAAEVGELFHQPLALVGGSVFVAGRKIDDGAHQRLDDVTLFESGVRPRLCGIMPLHARDNFVQFGRQLLCGSLVDRRIYATNPRGGQVGRNTELDA